MHIKIIIKTQQLIVLDKTKPLRQYTIATATNGVGEQKNSYKTPRGWHEIKLKIGAECPRNTVFKARRPTGESYSPELAKQYPERDWILTRILWLNGVEVGFNRYGQNDTFRRFIYIHGCPDEVQLGTPSSSGCIRMHNDDIIELFDWVPLKTRVLITEEDHAITKA